MKQLYSIPMIFHFNIGFDDSRDYIRVCASNKDTQEAILQFFQNTHENMLYGPFETIEYDCPCNVRNAERTHYILPVKSGLKHCVHPKADTPGNPVNPKP